MSLYINLIRIRNIRFFWKKADSTVEKKLDNFDGENGRLRVSFVTNAVTFWDVELSVISMLLAGWLMLRCCFAGTTFHDLFRFYSRGLHVFIVMGRIIISTLVLLCFMGFTLLRSTVFFSVENLKINWVDLFMNWLMLKMYGLRCGLKLIALMWINDLCFIDNFFDKFCGGKIFVYVNLSTILCMFLGDWLVNIIVEVFIVFTENLQSCN